MIDKKLTFMASEDIDAKSALNKLKDNYEDFGVEAADVVVALGGDGFMLETLQALSKRDISVYGMNRGTVGFLMNEFNYENLHERIKMAKQEIVNPLKMIATKTNDQKEEGLAINEISILRSGPQAAKLSISIDGAVRLQELVCDGALVCTPAGSTAYNYSVHGPILPIGANILGLTAISAYRPRRWRGALVPSDARIDIEVKSAVKRPVSAVADTSEVKDVSNVSIMIEKKIKHKLLFDPGHGLEERLLKEQFE
jgi:NAD+ kinase